MEKYFMNQILLIVAICLYSLSVSGQNLLLNGSFETGELDPWTAGNGNTVTLEEDATDGDLAARGNIEQLVSLEEGVNYTWTCQVKCLGGCDKNMWIGIRDMVGEALVTNYLFSTETEYAEAKIEFTAPSTGNHRFWVWGVAETDYIRDQHVLLKEGTSSVSGLKKTSEFKVMPTDDQVIIETGDLSADANIAVYSLGGNILYEKKVSASRISIPLSSFPASGIYIFSMEEENRRTTKQAFIRRVQ